MDGTDAAVKGDRGADHVSVKQIDPSRRYWTDAKIKFDGNLVRT